MNAIVTEAVPGKKLVWPLKRGITLPARLYLELADYDGGVAITHTRFAPGPEGHGEPSIPR